MNKTHKERRASEQLTLFKLGHVSFPPGHLQISILQVLAMLWMQLPVNITFHLLFELLELLITTSLQVSPIVMFNIQLMLVRELRLSSQISVPTLSV